jgi:hypothetical protein
MVFRLDSGAFALTEFAVMIAVAMLAAPAVFVSFG